MSREVEDSSCLMAEIMGGGKGEKRRGKKRRLYELPS